MQGLEEALEALGLPERDGYALTPSGQAFPDGGHYRIEISGVERVSALRTLTAESAREGVPVHRIIATVGGATYLTRSELEEFAVLAREARIEVVMTLGPRRGWDTGRQITTAEGLVSGMRLRGMDGVRQWLADLERCLEAGFRGFLVADEGLLWLLDELRSRSVIPPETIFKLSVFAGQANPAGARVAERLGADTFNPLADLTVPMLAAVRQSISIPMDVYMCLVNAMGGFVRFHEAAEIARVASPCYFKFEPGPSEAEIYAPWNPPEYHDRMIRERVRNAAVTMELIARSDPSIRCSPAGGEDLHIPR
ncbi:hypothetical protein [Arhodomonas sp. SL1]|uniref:hypothetical protein n=1 Tax=Arhodomonas sp. SL1 TaxID=3425691 RepID=UPI003F884D22